MVKKQEPTQSVSWQNNIKSFYQRNQTIIFCLIVGFLVGLLWFTAVRYLLVRTPETHYHANFSVFINGEREDFSEFTYYEEVAACTSAYDTNPKGRVHMHDKVSDVIHVHDKRVTYGNFFQNIGWNVGDEYLATQDDLFQSDETNKVTYILNGEEVDRIDNRVIGNTDKLLVSYGLVDTDFDAQFKTVTDTAGEVNKYQDPSTCGGLNGAGHDSVLSRLKRATFWQ